MKSLYTKALLSLVVLAVSMGLLLFAPALCLVMNFPNVELRLPK